MAFKATHKHVFSGRGCCWINVHYAIFIVEAALKPHGLPLKNRQNAAVLFIYEGTVCHHVEQWSHRSLLLWWSRQISKRCICFEQVSSRVSCGSEELEMAYGLIQHWKHRLFQILECKLICRRNSVRLWNVFIGIQLCNRAWWRPLRREGMVCCPRPAGNSAIGSPTSKHIELDCGFVMNSCELLDTDFHHLLLAWSYSISFSWQFYSCYDLYDLVAPLVKCVSFQY